MQSSWDLSIVFYETTVDPAYGGQTDVEEKWIIEYRYHSII